MLRNFPLLIQFCRLIYRKHALFKSHTRYYVSDKSIFNNVDIFTVCSVAYILDV